MIQRADAQGSTIAGFGTGRSSEMPAGPAHSQRPHATDLPVLDPPPLVPALKREASQDAARIENLTISVHTDLATIERPWREFERTARHTPFQSFDWLAKWQKHIGGPRGTVPLIVTGHTGDGEMLFLLPLSVEAHRGVRQLVWLANERCDYNGPLLAPDLESHRLDWKTCWRQIIAAIRQQATARIDLVHLQKMPHMVGDQANPLMQLEVARHPNDGHVATLTGNWDEFYKARRSGSSRKVQRKQLNRMAELGELRFVEPASPGENEMILDVLVSQKRRALARMGAADMFRRPGVYDFYKDLVCDAQLAGAVHVSRLDVGAEVAATSVALIKDRRYYLILSSYNDGPISAHGPGRAHLMELLRAAIAKGMEQFDFTIGNEPYKLDWCDVRVELFDHLAPITLRGHAMRLVLRVVRACHRSIRNNSAAWHAFAKARAHLHGLFRGQPSGRS